MGISIWQLLIVLALVILIFGTKKLRNIGSDMGSAVKSFKSAVSNPDDDATMKKTSSESETEASDDTAKDATKKDQA